MAPKEIYQPVPLLARELLRQALLISARDELSLGTRDPILRESGGPTGKDSTVLRLAMTHSLPDTDHMSFSIRRPDGTTWVHLLDGTAPFARRATWDYLALAAEAEKLSRTEFVKTLRDAGVANGAQPARNNAPLPDDVDQRLWSLNAIDQFAAVRQLHALTRDHGESSQLLAGLARGYANLGVLTEMHWNVSHKVFKARGLLYAQRLMARENGSPCALAHRAYVLALVGLHKDGLADVAEARKRGGQSSRPASEPATAPAEPTLPVWLDMVEAACQVDSQGLMEIVDAGDSFAGWAFLLRVLQLDFGNFDAGGTLATPDGDTIIKLVSAHPECLRALSLLNVVGKLGHSAMAGAAAFEEMDNALRERLPDVPGLPAEVQKLADDLQELEEDDGRQAGDDPRVRRVEIVRTLVRLGDPQKDRDEPSWSLLGHLMEEEYFDHAQQTAFRYKKQLGVDSAPFTKWAMGVVPDHPYRGYLESYLYRSGREQNYALENVHNLRCVDLDFQLEPVFNWFDFFMQRTLKITSAPWATALSYAGHDRVVRDLMFHASSRSDPRAAELGRNLMAVSPNHPVAAATLIRADWKTASTYIVEWDRIHCRNPQYLGELGMHYYREGPVDLAEACFKKLIEVRPEVWVYQRLAAIYKYKGQDEKFVSTLEESLKVPDAGLAHTDALITLAHYFRKKKDLENALSYAQQAAESGAGHGFTCLARCYEAMGNLDQAEEWMRHLAERYPESAYKWYIFCRIHHRDSLDKAKRLADASFEGRDNIQYGAGSKYGMYLLVSDEPQKAFDVYKTLFGHHNSPELGMHAVLLADELNLAAERDELLKQIIEKGPKYKHDGQPLTELVELARLLQASLSTGSTVDTKALDKLIRGARKGFGTNVCYFAGRFLERHEPVRGREYLRRAAADDDDQSPGTVLARCLASELGIELDQPSSQPASLPVEENPGGPKE
jgi:tetratricopeptide (TPR) repeat protein